MIQALTRPQQAQFPDALYSSQMECARFRSTRRRQISQCFPCAAFHGIWPKLDTTQQAQQPDQPRKPIAPRCALPSMSDLTLSWEERYAPRRDLAKKYSADWPLQFMLQRPILQGVDMRREF